MIIIEDVNEAPATIEITSEQGQLAFSKNSPRVNENSAPGTIVGTLFAYDEDLVERLTFTLDDNAKGRFSLDATTPCSNSSKTSFAKQQTICKVVYRAAMHQYVIMCCKTAVRVSCKLQPECSYLGGL